MGQRVGASCFLATLVLVLLAVQAQAQLAPGAPPTMGLVRAEGALPAELAGAEAQLKTAEINLGSTEIRAPIDGKITSTAVTEGNVVSPTSGTLATIVSQDPMDVLFPISLRAGLELRNRYEA